MVITGRVIKFGDNIDTDIIMPARYLNTFDPQELAKHCMESICQNFNEKVARNPILVAGKNFGCGSSREHAPLALKSAGVQCIIASSFARIFFRNAINIGLPVVESQDVFQDTSENDELEIDLEKGTIENKTKNRKYKINPYPEFLKEIINSGGLVNYVKKRK